MSDLLDVIQSKCYCVDVRSGSVKRFFIRDIAASKIKSKNSQMVIRLQPRNNPMLPPISPEKQYKRAPQMGQYHIKGVSLVSYKMGLYSII